MINKILNSNWACSAFAMKLKKSFVGQWFKHSWIFKFLKESAGDWRYPFFCATWEIANFLRRWRLARVDGVQFYLPCENPYTHMRYYTIKTKEPEVKQFLNEYLAEDDVLFDIGANIGILSLYSVLSKKGVIAYAFEPEYSTLSLLKDSVIKNKLSHKIYPYSVGVSDFVGLSRLHLQSLQGGGAAHSESQDNLQRTEEGYNIVGTEGIAAVTLDYLVEELNVTPNIIKIDTDGNELKILRGAENLLNDTKLKGLIIECPFIEETNTACRKILVEAGFNEIKLSTNIGGGNMGWVRN